MAYQRDNGNHRRSGASEYGSYMRPLNPTGSRSPSTRSRYGESRASSPRAVSASRPGSSSSRGTQSRRATGSAGSGSYHDSGGASRPRNAASYSRSGSAQRRAVRGSTARDDRPGRQRTAAASYDRPLPLRILGAIGHGISAVFAAIGRAFSFVWSKSRIAGAAILAVLVVSCVVALDSTFTADRIYKGVSVGDVDLSNMTLDEATDSINETYIPRLTATSVYIYADEETAASANLDLKMIENEALAEQVSFEEAQENKKLWITSAQALEASLPARAMAESAMAVGRETGFMDRLSALVSGKSIPVYADFNETLLSNLIADINATLGYPIQDFGIAFNDDAVAEVTEGNDGYVLNNEAFTKRINKELLADESSLVGFVAKVEHAPVKIDRETAQLTCDAINAVMPESVTFTSDGKDYTFAKATIAEWLGTEAAEAEGRSLLKPFVDRDLASPSVLAELNEDGTGSTVSVRFLKEGGNIVVQPEGEVAIPNIEEALRTLNGSMFDEFYATAAVPAGAEVPAIPINTEQYTGVLSVDDALSYGLVTRFSTFTTQYTHTTSTANRTFNIHLAADRIGDSIVAADGGRWSFNEIAGPCDEANGFREAGVIESGEYTTGIGGGICQVATTVFNAVYASGLPVNERHNHSLYSASYPAGRDAAIAYDTLDLEWTNTTKSDVLVKTSHTDTSVTVTLIGTAPGLTVSTDTGEWVEGEKYSTKYEVDESLGANESYVKIAGTDGMQITVVRTVKDADGNVVQKDTFKSVYSPITRVIAFGEGSDMAAIRDKYTEKTALTKTGSSSSSGSSGSSSSSSSSSSSATTASGGASPSSSSGSSGSSNDGDASAGSAQSGTAETMEAQTE